MLDLCPCSRFCRKAFSDCRTGLLPAWLRWVFFSSFFSFCYDAWVFRLSYENGLWRRRNGQMSYTGLLKNQSQNPGNCDHLPQRKILIWLSQNESGCFDEALPAPLRCVKTVEWISRRILQGKGSISFRSCFLKHSRATAYSRYDTPRPHTSVVKRLTTSRLLEDWILSE